jgi:hypothetical protein
VGADPGRGTGALQVLVVFDLVKFLGALLETYRARMCALLVGLPATVWVVGVTEWIRWLEVTVKSTGDRPGCECRGCVHGHGIRLVPLVDPPVFGRSVRLVWDKQRWRCVDCGTCWTDRDGEVGTSRCALTTQAARWVTVQVGCYGRMASEVADELGCDWDTNMDAGTTVGGQLVDAVHRYGRVTVLGLGETLFAKLGPFRTQYWSTQIVDVRCG